jgi:hypothetical protein
VGEISPAPPPDDPPAEASWARAESKLTTGIRVRIRSIFRAKAQTDAFFDIALLLFVTDPIRWDSLSENFCTANLK